MEIGVIGAGNVGGTLGRRWTQKGHKVVFGVREPNDEKVRPFWPLPARTPAPAVWRRLLRVR